MPTTYTNGTEGDDTLTLTPGRDVSFTFGGDDAVFGRGGKDQIDGGEGSDRLSGGAAADVLFGGDGDDVLFGRFGDDRLVASDGTSTDGADDDLYGGPGADRFEFTYPGAIGRDTIHDFEAGDQLDLGGPSSLTFDDYDTNGNDVLDGQDAGITAGRGTTVIDARVLDPDYAGPGVLTIIGSDALTVADFYYG